MDSLVTVTASISGTVNVSVCVCVIVESVVLARDRERHLGSRRRDLADRTEIHADLGGLPGRDLDLWDTRRSLEAGREVGEAQSERIRGRTQVLDSHSENGRHLCPIDRNGEEWILDYSNSKLTGTIGSQTIEVVRRRHLKQEVPDWRIGFYLRL